jgi:hypothetical protein
MDNIKNMKQATEYIYTQLKELNPDIQKDDVYDTIMDELLESVEYTLTDEDVKFLEDNEKNMTAIDEYLQSKIPDYKELLSDIVVDMVSDEIMDIE